MSWILNEEGNKVFELNVKQYKTKEQLESELNLINSEIDKLQLKANEILEILSEFE